jgi:exopolysaccharide production protein ExoQ
VLVIMTTPNPTEALASTLRRLSFLFLPMSLLFVKYYPDLGRAYKVQGDAMYTGIGHQKNDLGLMCLVAGAYFLWQMIQDRENFLNWSRSRRICTYILAGMMVWLLHMSDSQTSFTCLAMAGAVMMAARLPYVLRKPERLVGLLVGTGLIYFALDETLGLKNEVFRLLGRNPTLTNRTELWQLLFSIDTDPIFGSGFMSFWSGERMERVWREVGAGVNQAHSGYIEQFLNLGYVGVAFMLLLLAKALINARAEMRTDPSRATLRTSFVLAAILYNYTEASFYGISNMWILTLIALINLPGAPPAAAFGAALRPTQVPPNGKVPDVHVGAAGT